MAAALDDAFKKLFKGGGFLFLGLLAEMGVSFLAKVVIARVLGPIDYGAVSLGVTTLTLLSTLTLLGLHSGIGRYLPRFDDPGDRKGVILSALQIIVPVSVLTGLGVAAFSTTIATMLFKDPSVAPILIIFGLALPFAALMRVSIGVIQGIEQAVPKVLVDNIAPPVTRFTAVAGAIVLGASAINIAIAYALSYVVAAVVGFYFVFKRTSLLSAVPATRMHRSLLAFSLPLIVSTAMAWILSDVDTLMLGYYRTTSMVGIYNVVYPLAQLLTVALGAFAFLLMPIISRLDAEGSTDEMFRIYQIITKWVFMVTLPVFFVIALFPHMTIKITFGAEYVEGSTVLTILSIAYFSHAISGPNAEVLTSLGYTRLIMFDNIAIAALNIALNFILIPPFGYIGAGIATAISYIVMNLLFSIQLYRLTSIHPFSTALVRPGLAAAVLVAFIYWIVRTFLPITIPVLVLMFLVFMALYGMFILYFGGIQEEEVMLVLSFEDRFGIDLGLLKDLARFLMR